MCIRDSFSLDAAENKSMALLLRLECKESLLNQASKIVVETMKLFRKKYTLKEGAQSPNAITLTNVLKKHLRKFSEENSAIKNIYDSGSAQEDILRLIKVVKDDLKYLQQNNSSLREEFKALKDNLSTIEQKLEKNNLPIQKETKDIKEVKDTKLSKEVKEMTDVKKAIKQQQQNKKFEEFSSVDSDL
eukprot:TRINITY_DN1798_c0_g1_i3.p2 TRINITY_DN1798_c0_g1~~TRINITY_DN1798_c0_g1_i3.p2  ORF type:complete len:188 (+),score=34.00 TRINITY_DN1798_c0_g1_i3:62-625(+)